MPQSARVVQTTSSGKSTLISKGSKLHSATKSFGKSMLHEDGLFAAVLERHLEDLEDETESAAAASKTAMLWKGLMLCAIPIMGAVSVVSFDFANTRAVGGLPTSVMQLSHSFTLISSLSAVILFLYGRKELGQLYSRRYVGMSVGGGLNGIARILSFMALQRLGPTMVVVVQQSSSFVTLCFGILLLHRKPTCLSVASTIAGTLVAVTYVVNNIKSGENENNTVVDLIGVVFALLCVVSDKIGDILIEFVSCKFKMRLKPEERTPEVLRILIMNDIWKLPVAIFTLLVIDRNKAASVANWAKPPTLLAVFLPTAYNLLFNATIIVQSSLAVSLAGSGRVAIVYALEVVLLGTQSADLVCVLQLTCIVSVLVLSSAAQRESMKSAARERLKTLSVVKEMVQAEEARMSDALGKIEHAEEGTTPEQEIILQTESTHNVDEPAKNQVPTKSATDHRNSSTVRLAVSL